MEPRVADFRTGIRGQGRAGLVFDDHAARFLLDAVGSEVLGHVEEGVVDA